MQEHSPFSLVQALLAINAIAIPVASLLSAVAGYLFGRPQQKAKVELTRAEVEFQAAQTHKTDAQARDIDSRIFQRAYERLDELEVMNRAQAQTIIEIESKRSRLEWELELAKQREAVQTLTICQAQEELAVLREKHNIPVAVDVP
jgi:hypothetical protein